MLFLFLFGSFTTQEATLAKKICSCELTEVVNVDETTNEGRMIKILSDSGYSVRMQQIILAQAKFESGSFTNSLSKKYNNVFSMLHSKRDPYSMGNWGFAEGRVGYAVYKTFNESVYARLWYNRKWKYPNDSDLDDYVSTLYAKRYFIGDPKSSAQSNINMYKTGLKKLIDRDAHLFENKSVKIACVSSEI